MKKFSGVCLVTQDVLRLGAFYRDVLSVNIQGDDRHMTVATRGAGLAIFAAQGMEEMAPGSMQGAGCGSFTLEFQVEDVDSEVERLLGMGVRLVKPAETYPWGRRAAWFRDPDGNIVIFFEVVK
jgi:predicted enzyme related to lactoylglutathione lyase